MIRPLILAAVSLLIVGFSPVAAAEKSYGPGVTDTEIRIGQTVPYSGPISSLARFGRVEAAYLRKINASGGINGRRVTLVSLDDAFAPARTVEQTRKLVEGDGVLAIVGSVGTPTNLALRNISTARRCRRSFCSPARRSSTTPRICRGRPHS